MLGNIYQTIEALGPTGGDPDTEVTLGAPPGLDGLDGIGIFSLSPLGANTYRFTFTDESYSDFTVPAGQPGDRGQDGITPTFAAGTITVVTAGGTPAATVRASTIPNRYLIDFVLPVGPTGAVPWQTPPVPWTVSTPYTAVPPASTVTTSGGTFVCGASHTSGATFDSTKWVQVSVNGTNGTNGSMTGPASSVDGGIPIFNGTDGKTLKDSGKKITDLTAYMPRSAKTAAYTLVAADIGKFIDCSGGPWTLTGSAATVGAGWFVDIRNTLPGVIAFTPSSGTVDGRASISIYGESFRLLSDGTNFFTENRQRRVLVGTTTVASAVASVSFTGLNDTEINNYEFCYASTKSSDAGGVRIQLSQSGIFITSGYSYRNINPDASGTPVSSSGAAIIAIEIDSNGVGDAGAIRSGVVRIAGTQQGAGAVAVSGSALSSLQSQGRNGSQFWGWLPSGTATVVDGIRFASSGGGVNITAGTFSLYGLRG